MKNLTTLIKLQKTKVDEQRILLLKLQKQLDDLVEALARLEHEKSLQEELLHKEPSLSMTYGDYLKQYIAKKEFLEKEKSSTEQAVNKSRDQLAQLFEEQKRYEIAKQNRLDEETRERLRKETISLDEVGSISYLRNKNGHNKRGQKKR